MAPVDSSASLFPDGVVRLVSQTRKLDGGRALWLLGMLAVSSCQLGHGPETSGGGRRGVQGHPDTCGARQYAHLIGADIRQVPRRSPLNQFRLASETAAITADHSATRINIFFRSRDNRVVGIKCG